MEKSIKQMAAKLTQTASYVVTFDESKYRVGDIDRLLHLAEAVGSTAQVYEANGCNYIKISDPLCRMLEEAGMNPCPLRRVISRQSKQYASC